MRIFCAGFLSIIFAASAMAQTQAASIQQVPYAEIFLGYSYLNGDWRGLSPDRQNTHGWQVSLSTPLNRYFALDYDVSGNYTTMDVETGGELGLPPTIDMDVRDYSFLFGPRINYGPLFVHALVGGDCLQGRALGFSDLEWSWAGGFGGGAQFSISRRFSLRATADYILTKHEIFGSPVYQEGEYQYYPSLMENNFRLTAGLVIKLGSK
jgi:hypothetical protein